MARGSTLKLTTRQQAAIDAWKRSNTKRRCSKRALALEAQLPLTTLRRLLSPQPRNPTKREPDDDIEDLFESERDFRAKNGDHTRVTARFISEQLTEENGTSKFVTTARVQKAVTNNDDCRNPCKSPAHGEKARRAASLADAKHHHRP